MWKISLRWDLNTLFLLLNYLTPSVFGTLEILRKMLSKLKTCMKQKRFQKLYQVWILSFTKSIYKQITLPGLLQVFGDHWRTFPSMTKLPDLTVVLSSNYLQFYLNDKRLGTYGIQSLYNTYLLDSNQKSSHLIFARVGGGILAYISLHF